MSTSALEEFDEAVISTPSAVDGLATASSGRFSWVCWSGGGGSGRRGGRRWARPGGSRCVSVPWELAAQLVAASLPVASAVAAGPDCLTTGTSSLAPQAFWVSSCIAGLLGAGNLLVELNGIGGDWASVPAHMQKTSATKARTCRGPMPAGRMLDERSAWRPVPRYGTDPTGPIFCPVRIGSGVLIVVEPRPESRSRSPLPAVLPFLSHERCTESPVFRDTVDDSEGVVGA
jgi:hypothetical protein